MAAWYKNGNYEIDDCQFFTLLADLVLFKNFDS